MHISFLDLNLSLLLLRAVLCNKSRQLPILSIPSRCSKLHGTKVLQERKCNSGLLSCDDTRVSVDQALNLAPDRPAMSPPPPPPCHLFLCLLLLHLNLSLILKHLSAFSNSQN